MVAGAIVASFLVAAALFMAPGAQAGVAARLAIDVKPGPSGITPFGLSAFDQLTPIGDQLYFVPEFAQYGRELWRTDGKSAEMVRDIYPGPDYGFRSEQVPVEFQGRYYFQAHSPATGDELWRLTPDGNDAELVADVLPGPESGYPRGLTVFDGELYFVASNGTSGQEIFRYDGSQVEQFTDIKPGAGDAWPGFFQSNILGDWLYFLADDGIHGMELWRTNGQSTELFLDATPGAEGSSFSTLAVAGERLYFSTRTAYGIHLTGWRSDGESVEQLGPIEIGQVIQVGPRVYFVAGGRLWVVKAPGQQPEYRDVPYGAAISDLTVIGNDLYFVGTDDYHGAEPWRLHDGKFQLLGSPAGDGDGSIGWAPGGSGPFVDFDGQIFMTGSDDKYGTELWTLRDGRAVLYKDILPGRDSGMPGLFTNFGDEVYFIADDGVHGNELWHLFEDDSANLRVRGGVVKIRKGAVRIALRCPASEQAGPCRGRLELSRGSATIGKGSFRVGAGKEILLKVRVRRGLRPGTARLKVTVRDDAGNSKTLTRRLRLTR